MNRLALFLATSLVVSTAAAAAPLQPTGKWVVNFDDAQCVASRDYGKEQLFLKASPLGDVVQFGVSEPGYSGPPEQVEVELRPVNGAAFQGTAVRWSTEGKGTLRMRLINLSASEFQRLAASPSLAVRIGSFSRDYAMPSMSKLAQVMKSCVDDLQKEWSSEGGVAAQAQANLASYFTDDDYPEQAAQKNSTGTTGFALLIDEKGRVADCMVTQTSGQAGLDLQSCAIVKQRARFTPARDLSGKPTRDRVTSRISWRMP